MVCRCGMVCIGVGRVCRGVGMVCRCGMVCIGVGRVCRGVGIE